MPLTPVDYDPFADAAPPPAPVPATPAPAAAAPKLTPVDYDPFGGAGPSQGRGPDGAMLFPSAFIETPADPLGDMVLAGTEAARPYSDVRPPLRADVTDSAARADTVVGNLVEAGAARGPVGARGSGLQGDPYVAAPWGGMTDDEVYDKAPVGSWVKRADGSVVQRDVGVVEGMVRGGVRGAQALGQLPQRIANYGDAEALASDVTPTLAPGKYGPMPLGLGEVVDDLVQLVGGSPLPREVAIDVDTPEGAAEYAARAAGIGAEENRLARVAGINARGLEPSMATEAFFKADGLGDAIGALSEEPVGIMAPIAVESLVQYAPALAAMVVTRKPGVGAALAGGTSSTLELSNAIADRLAQMKIDPANEEAVRAALSDPAILREVIRDARAGAAVIGLLDAAAAGAASKVLAPARYTAGTRAATNIAAQTAVGGTLGGAGEAGKDIVQGDRIHWANVLAEIGAEGATAPVEAAVLGGQVATDTLPAEDSPTLRARVLDPKTPQPERLAAALELMNRGERVDLPPDARRAAAKAADPASATTPAPPSPIAAPAAAGAAPAASDDPELDDLLLRNLGDEVDPAAPAPVAGETPEASTGARSAPRSRAEREAARKASIAHLPYADLNGQTVTVPASIFNDDQPEDVQIMVGSDGSVAARRDDGQLIDISGMMKAGYPLERALNIAFAPDPNTVDLGAAAAPATPESDAAASAAPVDVGGSPAAAGADSPPAPVKGAPTLPESLRGPLEAFRAARAAAAANPTDDALDEAASDAQTAWHDAALNAGLNTEEWEAGDAFGAGDGPLPAFSELWIPEGSDEPAPQPKPARGRAVVPAPRGTGDDIDHFALAWMSDPERAPGSSIPVNGTVWQAVGGRENGRSVPLKWTDGKRILTPDEVVRLRGPVTIDGEVVRPALPAPGAVDLGSAAPAQTSARAPKRGKITPPPTRKTAAAPAVITPPPDGKPRMFAKRGAQAVQLPDGTWRTRIRKAGQWQPWQSRDTFDPSVAFGYRPFVPAGGAVKIDGKQLRLAPRQPRQPKPATSGPPKPPGLLQMLVTRKFDGLNREAFRAEFGVDPAEFATAKVGIQRVFTINGSMRPDDLREWMVENGYFPPEPDGSPPTVGVNEAYDLLRRALDGEDIFALDQQDEAAAWLSAQRGEAEQDDAERRRDVEAILEDEIPDIADEDMPTAVDLAIDLADLLERARAAGVPEWDLDPGEFATEVEFRRWITRKTHQLEAARGAESEADAGNLPAGEGRGVRSPERRYARDADAGAAGSGAGSGPDAGDAPARDGAPAQVSGGLFGAPSARDLVDGERRRRDDARNGRRGTGRTDMLAGDGELFAGDRPDQTRVESTSAPYGAPTFFSAALRAIEEGKGAPKRADAAAWKGWLDGAVRRGDMKQAERDWLGIDAWLADRGVTTRDELAEFVRTNEVQIRDVVHGGERTLDGVVGPDLQEWLEDNNVDPYDTSTSGDWRVIASNIAQQAEIAQEHGDEDEFMRLADLAEQATDMARSITGSRGVNPPVKFGDAGLQLPGGQNYQELLLTLPRKGAREAFTYEVGFGSGGGYPFNTRAEAEAFRDQRMPGANIVERPRAEDDDRSWNTRADYTAGHWETPNVLAHVRFNERTDADGNRVLFIEEIQSDWHQQARRKNPATGRPYGYRTGERTGPSDEEAARIAELQAEIQTLGGRVESLLLEIAEVSPRRIDDSLAFSERVQAHERWNNLMREREGVQARINAAYGEIAQLQDRNAGALPDAPFKSSEDWGLLAFKRMARWAADNGFDRIAWTTGEQQNDRYNLAKQVDWIDVVPPGRDGKRLVAIRPKNGTQINLTVSEDGTVAAGNRFAQEFAGKGLDEVVGKDMADKLMQATEEHHFAGVELEIGGRGMRGFYDEILPKAVNRWAKPFDAKVGPARITKPADDRQRSKVGGLTTEQKADLRELAKGARDMTLEEFNEELSDATGLEVTEDQFDDLVDLQRDPARRADAVRGFVEYINEAFKRGNVAGYDVHAIDVTDAMREAVGAGQAVFAPEQRYAVEGVDLFTRSRGEPAPEPVTVPPKTDPTLPLRPDGSAELTRKADLAIDKMIERTGGSVVADQIARDFRVEGAAALIGRRIYTHEDLAAIAQVYRNPAWETMRYVFVDDAGLIVGETALSCRMPASAEAFPEGVDAHAGPAWLAAEAQRFGATGVWLMHNHPSGNPEPSNADIAVTRYLAKDLRNIGGPKVMGHVILNHTTFGMINPQYDPDRPHIDVVDLPQADQNDPTRATRGAAGMLGAYVMSPAALAAVGASAAAASPDTAGTVIVAAANGRVTTVYSMPLRTMRSRRAAGVMSAVARRSGASVNFLVLSEAAARNVVAGDFARALERGYFTDILVVDGKGGYRSIAGGRAGFATASDLLDRQAKGSRMFGSTPKRTSRAGAVRRVYDDGTLYGEEGFDRVEAPRRVYTPAQEAALKKAGLPVDRRTTLQRVVDRLRTSWAELRAALSDPDARRASLVDKFHGLRAAEAQLGLTDPTRSAYVAARMTAGLPSIMESLMLFGAPKWDGGAASIAPNTRGLLDALKPVRGRLDDWLAWMVGRRAQLLASQGRENNLDPADIAELLALPGADLPAFQAAARDYLKIKNAVLDFAQEAGLIDPVSRAAWDHAEYIPFYRQDADDTVGPGTRRGLERQSSGIRTLKGAQADLHDPLANIVRNFTRLVDASLKNRAALLAVDELGAPFFTPAPHVVTPATIPLDQVKKHLLAQGVSPATIAAMPPSAIRGVQRMLSIVPPTGDDVVRVMRNGKAEYLRVADPLVLRALTGMAETSRTVVTKAFMWFKRLLTAGVTTTPEFIGANFLRDSAAAWVTSDDRFRPGWDSVRGAVNTLRNDPTTQKMMAAGATFMGGQYYGGDPDAAAAALRRALRQKGITANGVAGFMDTIARSPLHVWDKYIQLSSAIENANRRAVYDAAIKAGRSHLEASFLARDLLDFSMRGDAAWMRWAADVMPFLNARVQGLYKLGRRAAAPGGAKAMALRGGVLVIFSAGLLAWNLAMHGDAYDELEEWDKDAYWHIAPGTPWHLRIPKPFEVGLVFGTGVERIMQAIQGARTDYAEGDRPEQSFRAALHAITSTLAITPVPQAVLPLVEQWANKKFFTGRPIENMGDEKVMPELREEWYTSDTAKLLADLQARFTPRAGQISAKRIEHLWTGYTGGMGAYVLEASDAIVRANENRERVGRGEDRVERPGIMLRDLPLVGRFARGDNPPASTRYTTEFYDLFQRAEEVSQTIKRLEEAGNTERASELERANGWLLGDRVASKNATGGFMHTEVRRLRKIRDQLSQMRQDMEDIAAKPALNAQQKRDQIDALTAERNKVVRETVKGLRELQAGDGRESAPPAMNPTRWSETGNRSGKPAPVPFPVHNLGNPPKMVMVGSWKDVPNDRVRQRFEEGAEGVYDEEADTVYVVMGLSPARAKHVAFHEIAGHYGLRRVLGRDYEAILNRARQNPTVERLANAMRDKSYAQIGVHNRLALTEEALSELAAARQSGDYSEIERAWGEKIPASARRELAGVAERATQTIRQRVGALLGQEPGAMTDEEVLELLESSWRSVSGEADR